MTKPKIRNARRCPKCGGTGLITVTGRCARCKGVGWLPWDVTLAIGCDPGSASKSDCYAVTVLKGYGGDDPVWVENSDIDVVHWHKNKPPEDLKPNERVLLCVEKPSGRPHLKAPANRAIKRVRELWPRKNIIVEVLPSTWRSELYGSLPPKGEAKLWARDYCTKHLDYDPGDDPDGDKAESRCVLQWVMNELELYRRGAPNRIGGTECV